MKVLKIKGNPYTDYLDIDVYLTKGYESFLKRSKALLKKNNATPKGNSIIAEISSSIAMDMEFMNVKIRLFALLI